MYVMAKRKLDFPGQLKISHFGRVVHSRLEEDGTNWSITNGAMEALRRCHEELIAMVASELGSRSNDDFKVLNPRDICTSMNRIGLESLTVGMQRTKQSKRRSHKKKQFQVTEEMAARQEELIRRSKQIMRKQL